jgi:putative ABC transport system ATP-binding protein
MLRFENVTKIYEHRRAPVTGLDGVSLHVEQGEFIAVVGPSGSGKTTLLVTAGAMLHPTTGKVLLDDRDVFSLSLPEIAALRLEKIGFVFQTFNLIPYLTAQQNVMAPLMLAKKSTEEQSRRARELLTRVGLEQRIDHKPGELSVGQQQRVALARMLANDPPFILADEPTGNLDPDTSREAMDFLTELNEEGKTIVMVTHDPAAAERATRTLRLVEGRISPGQPLM